MVDSGTAITILLLVMFAVGGVVGWVLKWLATLLRRLGTMLVLKLDFDATNSGGFYSLEYRRPKGSFMGIKRGKQEGQVALKGAAILEPTEKGEASLDDRKVSPWQKKGGNMRAKLLVVDGQTATPLKRLLPEKRTLVFGDGWENQKVLGGEVVSQFTETDGEPGWMKFAIVAGAIAAVVACIMLFFVLNKLTGFVGGVAAGAH